MQQDKIVAVVAAVVQNHVGEILIALRPRHVHMGGLWEFPGGKIEPNETPRQALQRELMEELGIQVVEAEAMMVIDYAYPDKTIRLHVWQVGMHIGEPIGKEGQPIKWVQSTNLVKYDFPAANKPIIERLSSAPISATASTQPR